MNSNSAMVFEINARLQVQNFRLANVPGPDSSTMSYLHAPPCSNGIHSGFETEHTSVG